MATLVNDPERRTVPRWRPWRDAVTLGDSDVTRRIRTIETPNVIELMKTKFAWENNHSVPFAADFMGAAFALGKGSLARNAAEYVLTTRSKSSAVVRELAHRIYYENSGTSKAISEPRSLNEDTTRKTIRTIRASLRAHPRNPLAYMDLAREYVGNGQSAKAIRPIEIALELAPNNRFVLRSASRFFLHMQDRVRAHHILRSAARVKVDPWLLAAEIAVAGAAERTSSLLKVGRQLLESNAINSFHTSELASALATLECEAGNIKFGKRLIHQALMAPTENAVAQASWISRRIGDLKMDPHILETPRSYEARAWANMFKGEWQEGVDQAELWLRDESFSSRPAIFASWAASITFTEFQRAANFARQGLKTHPNDFLLLNNLAVALANMGQTEDAEKELQKVSPTDREGEYKATYLATKGLIQFRRGFSAEGRALYLMAVNETRDAKQNSLTVWAMLHHAREEFRCNPELALKITKGALSEITSLEKPQQGMTMQLYERVLREAKESEFM